MRHYLALFLVAMATLVFEITLSRLLSVVTWYHLSFFAVSVAMLGMTAGAVTVFLAQRAFAPPRLQRSIQFACAGFALSIPFSVWLICRTPLDTAVFGGKWLDNFVNLAIITSSCALPFYFSGIAISALLTRVALPVNRLYASDLLGAACGCLVVVAALNLFDAAGSSLLAASIALLGAALLFKSPLWQKAGVVTVAIVSVLLVTVGERIVVMDPPVTKGEYNQRTMLGIPVERERWNSFSRIVVSELFTGGASLWAAHYPLVKDVKSQQRLMNIDGLAGTAVRRYQTRADIEHLQYDVVNIGYFLRPQGGAAVIGVGGAKDVQTALLFGHERVLGVEVNPIFVDLLQNEFRDFAGVGDNPKVELVVDEARSYLSHSKEKFQILQMSLIDTWAATGAGAFSLSENALYTVEGWQTFLARLDDDGIFTVSRWFNKENLGETGRMISLAVAALLAEGVQDPQQHIIMVTQGSVASLLLAKSPFTSAELLKLRDSAEQMHHEVAIIPDRLPEQPVLAQLMQARTLEELQAISDNATLNLSPPTDLSPYFFNMLKLENLGAVVSEKVVQRGVVSGNLAATVTLLGLIAILALLTIPFIILPLWAHGRSSESSLKVQPTAVVFFACIGAGFMSLEIGLLQRLSVFLGHPIYALTVLLFGIIASTGLGSALSEKVNWRERQILLLVIGTAFLIVVTHVALNFIISTLIVEAMPLKIVASVIVILPLGLLLGCYFPTGLSLSNRSDGAQGAPWYWAINGIFGVLFSAVAVFISIYFSIGVNFYMAAALYSVTGLCLLSILRQSRISSSVPK